MPQKKRIEDIQKGRTNLFSLRWRDCEPASICRASVSDAAGVSQKRPAIKLNTRTDFGDLPEFAMSLVDGVKEPVLGYMGENGKFQLTNGERRWLGVRWLEENKGIKILLPCMREAKGYTDTERNFDLLRTNNGKALDMIEKAEAMRRLLQANLSPKEIARKAGCSTTHVVDCLALLNLSPEVEQAVRSGEIKPTLAVDLAREVPDKERQTEILKKGREKATASEKGKRPTPNAQRPTPKITAKHLPVKTGKKAQTAKKAKNIAPTGTSFSEPRPRRAVGLARPSGRDKTLDMLEELLEAVSRKDCDDTARYDTLEFLVEFAGGHKGMATATKFILGMI